MVGAEATSAFARLNRIKMALNRIHLALNRIDFATKAEPHEDRV